MVTRLFEDRLEAFLGLDAYFNCHGEPRGRWPATGLLRGDLRRPRPTGIKRLNFGEAVCGTVGLLRNAPWSPTDIQNSDDEKSFRSSKALGIRAYACNPAHGGRPSARHPSRLRPEIETGFSGRRARIPRGGSATYVAPRQKSGSGFLNERKKKRRAGPPGTEAPRPLSQSE